MEQEYVHYTEEEKKSKDRRPWDLYKDIIIKNEYDKEVNHHGIVNFYTSVEITDTEDAWVEFKAFFVYGKLDKIELLQYEKQPSRAIYNREWEEKRKLEAKKLWNRMKKILRYIGWRWFWNKMSRYSYKMSNIFSKIQWCDRAPVFSLPYQPKDLNEASRLDEFDQKIVRPWLTRHSRPSSDPPAKPDRGPHAEASQLHLTRKRSNP